MNRDDILDLLDRLWEHFDRTADIDSDGTPNASLEFCASLDAAKVALERMSAALDTALMFVEARETALGHTTPVGVTIRKAIGKREVRQ